jgi:GNAT superfamily N-acetyltransferase
VIQPVFHVYDFGYIARPPGIIQNFLPEKNKYTNFKNIETVVFQDSSPVKRQRFLHLIKEHYFKQKDNVFMPKMENIEPYFASHNDKSFLSFYYEDVNRINNKTGRIVVDKKPIGVMTTRPIHVIIHNGSKDVAQFSAYYVDYLCVDKQHRKKGIAPQIIQTHHYNQRRLNKKILVSIFKREGDLTGIVPLCAYLTYGFSVAKWTKPRDLSAEYKLLEVNAQNFHYLLDFIKENREKFDVVMNSDVANMIELVKTKNVFIYAVLSDDRIVSAYFFRKSCVQIEKNNEVLTCFASIRGSLDSEIFIHGFKVAFWKVAADNYFGFAGIENISHNDIIIHNIMQRTPPAIKSPAAYFFYNYAYPTFQANRVLIIN